MARKTRAIGSSSAAHSRIAQPKATWRAKTQTWDAITVTYLVTATDQAGNTSAATTLTYSVTR